MGKAKHTTVFILAAVAVALAVLLARQAGQHSEKHFAPKKLWAELDVEAVTRLELRHGGATITLRRGDAGSWGLVSRGSYPVDAERLRRTVLALAELKAVDQLTSNPAKYDRLGVGEVPENGHLRLHDSGGEVLAGIYLGKHRAGKGGAGAQGQFVRVEGDATTYVTETTLPLEREARRWLDTGLVDVPAATVREIRVEGEEGFVLARGEDGAMQLAGGAPQGKNVDPAGVASVSRALTGLRLSDVLPADAPEAAAVTFSSVYRAWTDEGMVYRVEAGQRADTGTHYLRLGVSYEVPPEPAEEAAMGTTEEATPANDAATRAAALDSRHAPWLYQVEEYSYRNFTKQRSELIQAADAP